MTRDLVIIGSGGFGREVFALIEALNGGYHQPWRVLGFVDDGPSAANRERVLALGSEILGSVSWLLDRRTAASVVIAIGSPPVRAEVATALSAADLDFPALVHPDATLGLAVTLGDGVIIAAGARLSTNIELEAHVQVDQNATIGHDTFVGTCSRLNPQACVSGSVRIGSGVLIGANATVLQNLQIGDHAVVGAQACVVHDVPADTVVKGVPAR